MKPEQLQILIEYRMEQAYDTVKEAEILFAEKAVRGTVNRAYYAMFYALLALFVQQDCYQTLLTEPLFDIKIMKAN